MIFSLTLQQASSDEHPPPAEIEQWVSAALTGHREQAEICIRIVDEDEICQLNGDYRNQPRATNVLSFPAELHADVDVPLLGDIVICAAVVEREADQQQKALSAHWAHMVVHGTLHLLGYDHIDDDDAERMEQLEVDILKQMNFPNPYINPIGGMHPKL